MNKVNEKEETVKARIKKQKEMILEQLEKTPIVQLACTKIGIGRATYYRWRKADSIFLKRADKALRQGKLFVNDMAESQLLSSIKDRNMTAIIFWLKNNHPDYKQKVEISTTKREGGKDLTDKQKEIIAQALEAAATYKIPKKCGGKNGKNTGKGK